jgi:hypothetical protein
MQIYLNDIINNIHNQDELDAVIAAYTNQYGMDASQWKIDNYVDLRQWAYPPYGEYLDAVVKVNSTEHELQAEGQAQLDKYYADCLAVKDRFPKE